MNQQETVKTNRPWVLAALAAGIAFCLWLLPWNRLLGSQPAGLERLLARLDAYCDLRVKSDWLKLYDMTDPQQRKVMPLTKFLTTYDTGVLKILSATRKSQKLDQTSGTASVVLGIEGMLDIDKLPPMYRKGLQNNDPAALRQKSDLTLDWVWRSGDWYFQMEKEVATGKTADGTPILPFPKASK